MRERLGKRRTVVGKEGTASDTGRSGDAVAIGREVETVLAVRLTIGGLISRRRRSGEGTKNEPAKRLSSTDTTARRITFNTGRANSGAVVGVGRVGALLGDDAGSERAGDGRLSSGGRIGGCTALGEARSRDEVGRSAVELLAAVKGRRLS